MFLMFRIDAKEWESWPNLSVGLTLAVRILNFDSPLLGVEMIFR